ncbi:glycosyltransferase family 4 protein [Synechococcus sp. CS-1331]|nr:glycosyltransferase family 4 protein [Synechococcus sp. CS-1331]
MNILMTSYSFFPDIGGIETIAELLADDFCDAGHSVILITKTKGDRSLDSLRFPFEVIRNPSILKLLKCYKWANVVFQNNIELRQAWPNLIFRKPIVISLHTWLLNIKGKRGLEEIIKHFALSAATKVIAVSNSIRIDSYSDALVIGNPYDNDLFRNYLSPRRPFSIVFLGRLVSDKGADLLLRSFAELDLPLARLTIIGSGPERQSLEQLARELDIDDSVLFVGPLQGSALVDLLNQNEVMVIPSIWREPFGIVALEGLACGCVPLVSDGGGLVDAVGQAGLSFKRGDIHDLTDKLRLLLSDQELRSNLRAKSAAHLSIFEKHKVSRQYLDVLNLCLRAPRKNQNPAHSSQ